MSENYLTIPGTRQKIYDGSVVRLSRFPGMKWIVHYGWYTYEGYQYSGWYFSSIPSNTVMPINDHDLQTLSVVATNGDCGCSYPSEGGSGCHPHPPQPIPPGPCPPGPPKPPPMPGRNSMITVDTIEQRNLLVDRHLPNGKIVRVNNVDGKVEYYEWDNVEFTWRPATLGERYLTKQETEETYATIDSVDELNKKVDELDAGVSWQYL